MKEIFKKTKALKPKLRQIIYREWNYYQFFPCYVSMNFMGDPTLKFFDVFQYLFSQSNPFTRLSTFLLWPFRILRLFKNQKTDGLSLPVSTKGINSIRFSTNFTNFYFYLSIRQMLDEDKISKKEKIEWLKVLYQIVNVMLQNSKILNINGDEFETYNFFLISEFKKSTTSFGYNFLKIIGLTKIESDADDTFISLEVFNNYLKFVDENPGLGLEGRGIQLLKSDIIRLLKNPYWRLLKYYQLRPENKISADVNYTDVEPFGGISTWFGNILSVDPPDLVVNVNVLRSLLVNRNYSKLFANDEAMDVAKYILNFIRQNVSNGAFRSNRGYCFYIPEMFVAMFSLLWNEFESLNHVEKNKLDPRKIMNEIRNEVISYLLQEISNNLNIFNPLDSALMLIALLKLNYFKESYMKDLLENIYNRFVKDKYCYQAYEIFKGKIPTHMVYGSEATTIAIVYYSISELEFFLKGEKVFKDTNLE